MKRLIFSLAAVSLVSGFANAGSFGPPPFSNGSPLVTGVDGSYQASARAKNVTGIFRFQYSNGIQTASSRENSWIFFINGQVQRGSVAASIGEGKVTGVLDSLSGGTATNSNGTIQLPIILLNANNSASGEFSGKIAPDGSFSGRGQILPSPGQTNQLIAISQEGFNIGTNSFSGPITITNATYVTSPGSVPQTVFKFRGVRSTSVSSASTNTATVTQ